MKSPFVLFSLLFFSLGGQAFGRLVPPGVCLNPRSHALAEPATPPQNTLAQAGFEGALVQKSQEPTVKYVPLFEKKNEHTLESKHFSVRISTISALNTRTGSSYKLLEINVVNKENVRIAYQRQYVANYEELNNIVMEFLDPESGEMYVVGIRHQAASKRLQGQK